MKTWQKVAKIIIALVASVVIVALVFSGYNYIKIKHVVLPDGLLLRLTQVVRRPRITLLIQ